MKRSASNDKSQLSHDDCELNTQLLYAIYDHLDDLVSVERSIRSLLLLMANFCFTLFSLHCSLPSSRSPYWRASSPVCPFRTSKLRHCSTLFTSRSASVIALQLLPMKVHHTEGHVFSSLLFSFVPTLACVRVCCTSPTAWRPEMKPGTHLCYFRWVGKAFHPLSPLKVTRTQPLHRTVAYTCRYTWTCFSACIECRYPVTFNPNIHKYLSHVQFLVYMCIYILYSWDDSSTDTQKRRSMKLIMLIFHSLLLSPVTRCSLNGWFDDGQNPIFTYQSSYTVLATLLRRIISMPSYEHQLLIHLFTKYVLYNCCLFTSNLLSLFNLFSRIEANRFKLVVKRLLQFITIREFPPSNGHKLPTLSKSKWWIPCATRVLAILCKLFTCYWWYCLMTLITLFLM